MQNEKDNITLKSQEIQQLTSPSLAAESTLAITQQKLEAEEAKSQSLSDEKAGLSRELQDIKTTLEIANKHLLFTMEKLASAEKELSDTRHQLDATSTGLQQISQELDEYKSKLQAAEKLIKEKDESIIHKDTLLKWAKETEDKLNAEIDKLKKEKSDLHKDLEST